MWWCIAVAGLLSGCGVIAFLVNEPTPSERSLMLQQGALPVEVRLWGHPPVWERLEEGSIRIGAGTVMGMRVRGLTMFTATFRLHSTGGYRLWVRTTPHEWRQRSEAALELTVEAEQLRVHTGARRDTLEIPTAGSHSWRLTQWERGVEARFECLPPMWFATEQPLTEWILLEPLPGSEVTLEALTVTEAIPLLWPGTQE